MTPTPFPLDIKMPSDYTPLPKDEVNYWNEFNNKYSSQTQCAMIRGVWGPSQNYVRAPGLANLASLWGEDASGRPLRGMDTIKKACGDNVQEPLDFTAAMDLSGSDSFSMCNQLAQPFSGCHIERPMKEAAHAPWHKYPKNVADSPMMCYNEVFQSCLSATQMGDTSASLAERPTKRERGISSAY